MVDEFEATPEVRGRVKWFDPSKGYGFVVAEDGGPDILLHANVLRNFGQSTVSDGVEVRVIVQQTHRGTQAVEVLEISLPPMTGTFPIDDMGDIAPEALASQSLEPARVKWFDKAKGFGFANVFGSGDDVFIHIEVLRRSGFADLQPGEAIGLRIIEGPRGQMATQVTSWEAALRQEQ